MEPILTADPLIMTTASAAGVEQEVVKFPEVEGWVLVSGRFPGGRDVAGHARADQE
jgi:hypothetical protein